MGDLNPPPTDVWNPPPVEAGDIDVCYMRIAVIAYNDEMRFYENCGFIKSSDASPMFITSLWT